MSGAFLYALAALAFFVHDLRQDRFSWGHFGLALFTGLCWFPMIVWLAIVPERD